MTVQVVDVVSELHQVVEVPVAVGPPGPSGNTGAALVLHTQTTPLATWTISHSLDHHPLVAVIIDGREVIADIEYPDSTTVVVTHATPQTGEVIAA